MLKCSSQVLFLLFTRMHSQTLSWNISDTLFSQTSSEQTFSVFFFFSFSLPVFLSLMKINIRLFFLQLTTWIKRKSTNSQPNQAGPHLHTCNNFKLLNFVQCNIYSMTWLYSLRSHYPTTEKKTNHVMYTRVISLS